MTTTRPAARSAAHEAFGHYLRPRLDELLQALRLDIIYERGQGDFLYYRDEHGHEVEVLDLLGGYGASLLGHNHPELVAIANQVLAAGRPFNAQASVRGPAARLAERLASSVGRLTGRSYVVTFGNSGTEAVEAAIKHAEFERIRRLEGIVDRVRRTMREVRRGQRENTIHVPDALFSSATERWGLPRDADLEEVFGRVLRQNLDAFERQPLVVAVERSFHGKSLGSLMLTSNPQFRIPWRSLGLRSTFLHPEDEGEIGALLERERVAYLDLAISEGGEVRFVERSFVNIVGCFVEPVQGEGGIHELSSAYLHALRRAADEGEFPLVIDEIQCGLGRTGAFLASEPPAGVRGDYYLFSKALGGGLAKISALLVDRTRYNPDFGYLHTSTFSDDDFSSVVGLGVLDLLERHDGALIRRCAETGQYLLGRLRALQAAYPDVIKEVRGRGLMVGIELAPQLGSASPLIRVLSEQNLLGMFASGYLLHKHGIRVAPTLSSHQTIRIEPSVYIQHRQIDRFSTAFEQLLATLRNADSFELVGFLAGESGPRVVGESGSGAAIAPRVHLPVDVRMDRGPASRPPRKVAFLGHYLEAGNLRDWDRGLRGLSVAGCETFLERTRGRLDPFVTQCCEVRSVTGDVVDLTVIGVPFTPAQVMASFRSGDVGWALELIDKALRLAKRLGCSVVGFGGYTSILTNNCRAVVDDEVTLTSGNSLAAAAAVEALRQAVGRLRLASVRLGVLGAAGNIGSVLAAIAADHWADIVLVGRPGSARRLEQTAVDVYAEAWRLRAAGQMDGLAGAIATSRTVRDLLERAGQPSLEQVGEELRLGLLRERGDAAPVRVVTDMAALQACNVILSVTNAPEPLLRAEHIGTGPAIVCDVAVPGDVDPTLPRDRPDVLVLRGGLLKAPFGQTLSIDGMPLGPGQVYGCLAETILLGLAGLRESPSYGKLTPANVRWVGELAQRHGWSIEEHPVDANQGEDVCH